MSTRKPVGNPSLTKNPLISVLIPTYNRADFIGEAIASVLAQNYTPLEIIVVDDGSTDNTRELLTKYDPKIVKYFYQKNNGISSARNECLRHARGKYIAWLDSDDYYLPGKLRAQLEYLRAHPRCQIVFTRYQNFLYSKQKLSHARIDDEIQLAARNRIYLPSALMEKSLFKTYGNFLERLAIGEDTELLFRFKVFGVDLSHCLEKVFYQRRLHGQNIVLNYQPKLYVVGKNGKTYNYETANLRKITRPKYAQFAPKISVIIPAKNAAAYLAQSIQSIHNQTLNVHTEIIVVDDGSTDETVKIATAFNCQVFSLPAPGKGATAARNLGLKKAHGDYIVFHDADDLLSKNALALMYSELCKYDGLQVVFAMREDFISPELPAEEKAKLLITTANFGAMAGCAMIKKEVFKIVGNFDKDLVASDIAWQMQLVDHEIKVHKLAHVTCWRRLHLHNFSRYYRESGFRDYALLLRRRLKNSVKNRNYAKHTKTLWQLLNQEQQLFLINQRKQEKAAFYHDKVWRLRQRLLSSEQKQKQLNDFYSWQVWRLRQKHEAEDR